MKMLSWLVAIFVLAVLLALSARFNTAYVQIVYAPWRVELSLSFAVVVVTIGFFALYTFVRLVVHALRLPAQVRSYRIRRARNKARGALHQALTAFFEGSFARAEKLASTALQMNESPGVAAAIAARSAHALGHFDERDRYLDAVDNAGVEADSLRLLTRAELLLEQHDFVRALDALRTLRERAPRNMAAVRLELKAHVQARNWDQVLATLDLLRRQEAIDPISAEQLRITAHRENLKESARDRNMFLDYWGRIPSADRTLPSVVESAAGHMIELGLHDQARDLIERALAREWRPEIAALYGDCVASDPISQLQTAERWLTEHSNDAALLCALGNLCARASLWGKARSYLEASLAVEPTRAAHAALARLLEAIGKPEEALRHNRRAIDGDDLAR